MQSSCGGSKQARQLDLAEVITQQEWARCRPVLERSLARGLRCALGGGLAFSAYASRQRNTKDIDLFILPVAREAMIEVVTDAGFKDYFDQTPYDRTWIYRGFKDGTIIDLIWSMVNHRAEVDEAWLTRGREIDIYGTRLRLLPLEELLWSKLYVMQRDRCDWPDILNLLSMQGHALGWEYLLGRVGEDVLVLGGVMNLFKWLCPLQARDLPYWIWDRLGLSPPETRRDCDEDRWRAALLDSRDWFGPTV